MSMQRADMRKKYNLDGSCLMDIATSCCCGCCSLVQQDKEAAHHEPLLQSSVDTKQYQAPAGMEYKEGAKN